MKKVLSSLILAVLLATVLFLTSDYIYKLSYNKINNYYMDVTILENGDVLVKKLLDYQGKYDNYEITNIKTTYKENLNVSKLETYSNSKIYNYDSLELITIETIKKDDNFSFNYMYNKGETLKEESTKKDKTYEIEDDDFIIYNENNDAIYIEYILKNYAVIHSDVAELLLNIVENEKINNLVVIVHLPENQSILLSYLHGSSSVSIKEENSETIKITGNNLTKNDYLFTRIVFDKEVIPSSQKQTSVQSLDNIKLQEEKLNEEYIEKNNKENTKKIIGLSLDIVKTIWLAVTIVLLMRTYLKYDMEYKRKFKKEKLKKIPSNIEPYELEYLNYRKITQVSIKSILLKMINEDKITVKENKDDYILKVNKVKLNEIEDYIVNLFFKSKVKKLSDLKIKTKSPYSEYSYDELIKMLENDTIKQKYFEDSRTIKKLLINYSLLGIILNLISHFVISNIVITVSIYIVSFTTLLYYILFKKKTKKGNEEYHKWQAYKNYLLKQTNNLEEDIIYANIFGIEKKLLKRELDKKTDFYKRLFELNILRTDITSGTHNGMTI